MFRLLALLPLLAACASGPKGDATAGATVFADNCAVCHGADATGGSGPSLVGEMEGGESTDIILNGQGDMPAFADILSEQDIADVIAWIESLGGGGADESGDA